MSNCECEVSLITTNETCEIITPLQTQHRSSVRISHIGTTHQADSDATRWCRHPWSLHYSTRTPEQADTARGFCFQATLWCTRQQGSSWCSPFQVSTSHPPEILATRLPSDQHVLMQCCDHGVSSRDSDTAAVPKIRQLALDPRRSRTRHDGREQLAFSA